jgi:hypothetical protein
VELLLARLELTAVVLLRVLAVVVVLQTVL